MKVLCEKCGASHELDDSRIPAQGMVMKCPACLHSFPVKPERQVTPGGAVPEPAFAASSRPTVMGMGPTDLPPPKPPAAAPAPPPKKATTTRYHVRRRTGRTFGPFLETAIIAMLEQGKLDGDEDLSVDGETWQALAEFPSLARYYHAPKQPAPPAPPTAPQPAITADDADLPAPKRSTGNGMELPVPQSFFDEQRTKAAGRRPAFGGRGTGSAPTPRPPLATTPSGATPRPPAATAPPARPPSTPSLPLDDRDLLAPVSPPSPGGLPLDDRDLLAPVSPPSPGGLPLDDRDLLVPKGDLDLPEPKRSAAPAPPPPPPGGSFDDIDLPAPKTGAPLETAATPAVPTRPDRPPVPAPGTPPPPRGARPPSPPPPPPGVPAAPPPPPLAASPTSSPGDASPASAASDGLSLDDLDLPMVEFGSQDGAGGSPALDLDEPSPEPGPLPQAPPSPATTDAGAFELDDLDLEPAGDGDYAMPSAPPPPSPSTHAAPPETDFDAAAGDGAMIDLSAGDVSTTSDESMLRGPGGEFLPPDDASMDEMPGVIDLARPSPAGERDEAAFNLDEAPPPTPAATAAGPAPATAATPGAHVPTPAPTSGKRRVLILALIGVVVIGGAAAAVGLFGKELLGLKTTPGGTAPAAEVAAARTLMLQDTLPALTKAAHRLTAGGTDDLQRRGLAAQALLWAMVAHTGPQALQGKAANALGTLPPDATPPPEYNRARAFLAMIKGQRADGGQLMAAAGPPPPGDAVAQIVTGWSQMAAGNPKAAKETFTAAVKVGGAAALYGAGTAHEALGEQPVAADLYAKALALAPQHAGSALGAARVTPELGAREAALNRFLTERAAQASPGQRATALALLGDLSLEAGNLTVAETKFNEALQAFPASVPAQTGLAHVFFETGRYDEASTRYQQLRRLAPQDVAPAIGLARCFLESGRLLDADAPLAAAERLAPQDARVLTLRGLRQELADTPAGLEGAVKSYLGAIKASPKHAEAYAYLARTYLKLKRDSDAFSALKQGHAMIPGSPLISNAYGEASLKLKDAAQAEPRFRAALAKNPNFHRARLNLGTALEQLNRLEDAAQEYEVLASKAKQLPGLAERRARLYQKMGQVEKALAAFAEALEGPHPTLPLRLAAAEIFIRNGTRQPCLPRPAPAAAAPAATAPDGGAATAPPSADAAAAPGAAAPDAAAAPDPSGGRTCFDLARQTLDAIILEDPRNADAQDLMAVTLAGLGRPEEGLSYARRAITLDVKRPLFHLHVGQILGQLARFSQAMQELDLAIGGDPSLVDAYIARGRIFLRQRLFRQALIELTKADQRDRQNPEIPLLMGEAYSGLRQLGPAINAYRTAVKRTPTNALAHYKLGEACADAERRGPAVESFKRALSLGGDKAPWAPEAHRRLGYIHKESGSRAAAVAELRRYLELKPNAPDKGEILQQIRFLQ